MKIEIDPNELQPGVSKAFRIVRGFEETIGIEIYLKGETDDNYLILWLDNVSDLRSFTNRLVNAINQGTL